MRRTTLLALTVLGGSLLGGLAQPAMAGDVVIDEPVVRGEVARLLRQAYDYQHRNSNRNVFRKSRHFHPTQNVFRSSRHYQQRLAASSDGYPLRTFVRYGRSVDGGPRRQIEYSYATHRRAPFGLPSIEEPGLEALVLSSGGVVNNRRHDDRSSSRPIEYRLITPASAAAALDQRLSNETVDNEPGRDAVLHRIEQPDGTVQVVITNSPITTGETVDDAWTLLTAGNTSDSAALFKQHVMDSKRGAEAMVGYGLAKLLDGEWTDAASALRRAQRLDGQILIRVLIEQPLANRLSARRDALPDDLDPADRSAIENALEQLLDS